MATVPVASRGLTNTAFTVNNDFSAQITGSGVPAPGWVGNAAIASGFVPVYAATIDLSNILQVTRWVNIVTTALGNATITALNIPPAGCQVTMQVNNDAGGARTITFGTGFRSTATVVGTASKVIIVTFTSDGLTLNEDGRTAAAV